MNKILQIAALLVALLCLASCTEDTVDALEEGVKMRARIIEITDGLEVEVIEGEYRASGIYWIILSDSTEFLTRGGGRTTRDALKIGSEIEITYGGQVMMSLPPQVVAKRIVIL